MNAQNSPCKFKKSRIIYTRLILRSILALAVFIFYFSDRSKLDFNADGRIFSSSFLSSPILVILFIFVSADFTLRLFPMPYSDTGVKKSYACGFKATKEHPERDSVFFKKAQIHALRAVITYVVANGIYILPVLLIRFHIWNPAHWSFLPSPIIQFLVNFGAPELVVGTMIYYVLDIFFIRWWCIFRNVINKNRCCTTCRIYCWDGIMCITPLFLAPLTLFSMPIILLAFLSFLRYEISFYKHPEYFNEKENVLLSCASCHNNVCPRKKKHSGITVLDNKQNSKKKT